MAAPIRPAGVSAFGNEKWIVVPKGVILDPENPTEDEINDPTALDISGFLYVDGFDGLTSDTTRVNAPRRIMDRSQNQSLGTTTRTMGDLIYTLSPQSADNSDEKKAYTTLLEGLEFDLVWGPGLDKDADVAGGDFVKVIPITLGPQDETTTGRGEEGEFAVRQAVGITDIPTRLVEVATS